MTGLNITQLSPHSLCNFGQECTIWRPVPFRQSRLRPLGTEPMNSANQPEPLAYSIADACKVSSIGKTRLYSLIAEGRLEARKIGKRTLIPAASLRALIEGEG